MLAFRLLIAGVLVLTAANGAYADLSALNDCKKALQRGDFSAAIPFCVLARETAKTPMDEAMASALLNRAQAATEMARTPKVLDGGIVVDPDTRQRLPKLHENRRPLDEAMIIDPYGIDAPIGGVP